MYKIRCFDSLNVIILLGSWENTRTFQNHGKYNSIWRINELGFVREINHCWFYAFAVCRTYVVCIKQMTIFGENRNVSWRMTADTIYLDNRMKHLEKFQLHPRPKSQVVSRLEYNLRRWTWSISRKAKKMILFWLHRIQVFVINLLRVLKMMNNWWKKISIWFCTHHTNILMTW